MARRASTFDRTNNRYTITAGSAAETVIGVVLKKEIPQSVSDSGTAGSTRYTESDQTVEIRPTNVTAVISSTAGATNDPDYIVLKNGPKGGFKQNLPLTADGVYQVNAVIEAVITE